MNTQVDVLVIGTGVAGLYATLQLREDLNILLVTKSTYDKCNTYLAQGGIATAISEEDVPLFIEDTLKAGKYKNKMEAVETLAKESMENILQVIQYGMEFDSDERGLLLTKEGAHRINRIVHHKDYTGQALAEALWKEVSKRKNVVIKQETKLLDLVVENNVCRGAVLSHNKEQFIVDSKVVILATGGVGGVFKSSTNQRTMTGDGVALALKHGIELKDTQYIQFHPTALYTGKEEGKRFLISEAVRGEGAKLYNIYKEPFVDELLPRDEVTKAILDEMKKTQSEYVYLDLSFMDSEYIKRRFPTIYQQCLQQGIDITKQPIPVSPAQHYFMGGIETDLNGKTSMKNLFAVGEVSCTGLHGANRLASNSLQEGLVFSRRAARYINKVINDLQWSSHHWEVPNVDEEKLKQENLQKVKQYLMAKGGYHAELFVD